MRENVREKIETRDQEILKEIEQRISNGRNRERVPEKGD